jgi:hypothetical protein
VEVTLCHVSDIAYSSYIQGISLVCDWRNHLIAASVLLKNRKRGVFARKNHFLCKPRNLKMPVTVAEQSEACTAFARSEARIVGSNPTQGIDV